MKTNYREQPPQTLPEKRRGVFDFYKRRNSASRDTLSNPSVEAVQLGTDPLNAYSPLLSIYHLVKEKLDRERLESKPGALGVPHATGDSMLQMPDLPAPEAAHTNQYQLPGEKDAGRRTRPRARTHGDDEIGDGLADLNLGPQSGQGQPSAPPASQPETPAKKESTAAGILRRFSTRRGTRGREMERDHKPGHGHTPSLNVQPPADSASPLHRGFSMRRSRRAIGKVVVRCNVVSFVHPWMAHNFRQAGALLRIRDQHARNDAATLYTICEKANHRWGEFMKEANLPVVSPCGYSTLPFLIFACNCGML